MSETGDLYRSIREAGKKQRAERLLKADEQGWGKYTSHHWYAEVDGFLIQYYPSTGTIVYQGTKCKAWSKKGKKLLEKVKNGEG